MKSNFFLTRNGILCQLENNKSAFFTNSFSFVRECPNDEATYLINEIGLAKIEIEYFSIGMSNDFAVWRDKEGNFPKWHLLKTVEICQDNRSYRSGTSCDGGDYSYTTFADFFAMKTLSGEWKFARIEHGGTSAEFSYDELAMSFQNDLGSVTIENCEDNVSYRTQTPDGEDTYDLLEKLGSVISFEEMWNTGFEYMGQDNLEEDEDPSYIGSALSFSDKKEILSKLKEHGWERLYRVKRSRRFRRGGGRRG